METASEKKLNYGSKVGLGLSTYMSALVQGTLGNYKQK